MIERGSLNGDDFRIVLVDHGVWCDTNRTNGYNIVPFQRIDARWGIRTKHLGCHGIPSISVDPSCFSICGQVPRMYGRLDVRCRGYIQHQQLQYQRQRVRPMSKRTTKQLWLFEKEKNRNEIILLTLSTFLKNTFEAHLIKLIKYCK